MVIEEMTERECRAMLARTNVARLACVHDNQPYIVPIHVDLDGEFLYGYATLGKKIEWMRQNPLVCLEIDDLMTHGEWTSVAVFGRYEELPHTPEYEGPRRVAERLFQRHPAWWEPASVPLGAHERRTPIAFRIQIGRLTTCGAPDRATIARPAERFRGETAALAGSGSAQRSGAPAVLRLSGRRVSSCASAAP
jgi:nitroimidazol reductase NimA-like FMN-containing flavoprotein (pyridoxamine 5'-phosphate oxidase superfamily)